MTPDNLGFYLQNSQTGGQWYSDTSPFSIPHVPSQKSSFNFGIPRLALQTHLVCWSNGWVAKFTV
jgi:hypothetical protein